MYRPKAKNVEKVPKIDGNPLFISDDVKTGNEYALSRGKSK